MKETPTLNSKVNTYTQEKLIEGYSREVTDKTRSKDLSGTKLNESLKRGRWLRGMERALFIGTGAASWHGKVDMAGLPSQVSSLT
mgnify:CR=1 FL=1